MKYFFFIFAISLTKLIGFLSNLFGSGKGAAAPGLVALKIYPNLINNLTKNINKQKILISATNGKTTTVAMICAILEEIGASYVCNDTGSNLLRGIASALISQSDLGGNFEADYGVFEVDEAVLPYAIEQIKPDIIILGNVFRDQLDRYGEIDTILAKWKKALQGADSKIKLILNADDPGIAGLRNGLRQETIFYGIKENNKNDGVLLDHAADSINCPNCQKELIYKNRQFSHLGNYQCPKCDFSRPKIDIAATNILISVKKTCFDWNDKKVSINISGIYNVYNALAAIGAGKILDINNEVIISALAKVKPAFGRMEEFELNGQKFKIILIKNPTGANAVIDTLKNIKNKQLIIALNDNIADGTDVSWIYDVDWEKLITRELDIANKITNRDKDRKKLIQNIVCLGTRKYDLALRLKYANISEKMIKIGDDYFDEIKQMSQNDKDQEYIYILPTYTAMLEIRKELEKKKIVQKI